MHNKSSTHTSCKAKTSWNAFTLRRSCMFLRQKGLKMICGGRFRHASKWKNTVMIHFQLCKQVRGKQVRGLHAPQGVYFKDVCFACSFVVILRLIFFLLHYMSKTVIFHTQKKLNALQHVTKKIYISYIWSKSQRWSAMQAIKDNIGWLICIADLKCTIIVLSLSFPHRRPQKHKIWPFLGIVFEVKSKENTTQNLLNQPGASCINLGTMS